MQKLAAVVLALLAALAASYSAAATGGPVRLQLTHVDAGRGLSQRELLRRMALRSQSQARAARFLSGSSASAPVTPGQRTEYLVHLGIGTPPQPVQVTLDTGSDLVWTQCRPCAPCFHQALPHFDPSLSSTFAELPCGSSACQGLDTPSCGRAARSSGGNRTCVYTYSYGDNSTTSGQLDADTFTFDGGDDGPTAVPSLSFGCGHNNTGIFNSNETGIAGFGRGALSLPSQLRIHNFSYCFTNITGATPSPVLLGLPANLYRSASSGEVQTTPLIQNPARPALYYLPLQGVTVGSTRLPIPESTFALAANGTGGAIIDSGTSMTWLPQDVYNLLTDEFVAQARLPMNNSTSLSQLCFSAPSSSSQTKPDDVPRLLLHFEGATLDLPRENYMFEVEEEGRSLTCLAVNAGDDLTIIGNYQQQNMHVLYDLANDELSFVPAQCDRV